MAANESLIRHPLFNMIKKIARAVVPQHTVIGKENVLQDYPAVFVCNHLGSYAPVILELFSPLKLRPWVMHDTMNLGLCRKYIQKDFVEKELRLAPMPAGVVAALIAPFCVLVLRAVEAIPVYKGEMKLKETYDISIAALKKGQNIVIYPENEQKRFSRFVNEFYTGFIHIARLYYKKTGLTLNFYPVFVDRDKRTITIGKPIRFSPFCDFSKEKASIAAYLVRSIHVLAKESKDDKCS